MQTTLLGLAIALILALMAALVGPFFIDWSQFRPQFEAEASRIMGAPVRVEGPLDARLLPAPTLRLNAVTLGSTRDASRIRAGKLDVEFSLSSLMRGEWRATELTLDAVDLTLQLDDQGRLAALSAPGLSNLGALTVDRLTLAGRVTLRDAQAGRAVTLDRVTFAGDVRGPAAAFRGDGEATVGERRVVYRLSSAPAPDNAGQRVRLTFDGARAGVGTEIDGLVTLPAGRPTFEGTLNLTRPVALASSAGALALPWRITSRLTADAQSVRLDQIDAAYGTEDSPLKFSGRAALTLGADPSFDLAMTARQLDADRFLARQGLPAEPFRQIGWLRAAIAAMPPPPMPASVTLGVDAVTLGGRPIQDVALALRGSGTDWRIETFEARIPGATRVTLKDGAIASGSDPRLTGAVSLDSADPDVLLGWLRGQSDLTWRAQQAVQATAQLEVTPRMLALSPFNIRLASGPLSGRVSLSESDQGRTKLDLDVSGDDIALNDPPAFGLALRDATAAALDVSAAVALKRLIVAKREFRNVGLRMQGSADVIAVDRLAFAGSDGGTVEASGRVDRRAGSGSGRIHVGDAATALTLAGLDGVVAASGPLDVEFSASMAANALPRLRARIAGAALDAEIEGASPLSADFDGAVLDLKVRQADIAPLAGMSGDNGLSAALSSKLSITRDAFTFDDLDVQIAGTRARGKLSLTRGPTPRFAGEIGMDTLDLPAAFAALIGARAAPETPLGMPLLRDWQGELNFQALSASLGGIELRPAKGTLTRNADSLFAGRVQGVLGGGSAELTSEARPSGDGVSLNMGVTLKDVDNAALRYRALMMPPGKSSLQATLTSRGRSPSALQGALSGGGTLHASGVRLSNFGLGAFDAAITAADSKTVPNDEALRDVVKLAMGEGALNLPPVDLPFTVSDGRLRVAATSVTTDEARLTLSGGYDWPADQIDGRVALARRDAARQANEPEIGLFIHGTPDAPQTMIDVSALSSWLALRAIDRETRRLDAIERGELPADAPVNAGAPPRAPAAAAPASVAPAGVAPSLAPSAGTPARRAAPKPVLPTPSPPPAVTSSAGPSLAPLPPPIDIKPAPTPRASKRTAPPATGWPTPPARMP